MTDPTGDPPPQPAGGYQVAVAPGPAPGVAYAALLPRVIAIIIDVILIGFIYAVVVAVLGSLGGWGAFVIAGLIHVAISVGYFVYLWTRLRATLGQRFLGLETVNAADGATLTQDQALRRWAFLLGPGAVAQIFGYGGGTVVGGVGLLIALLALIYEVYLLYSASQSPTRQGFHDVQAQTVVVRRTG
jgi:hypothetical protein